MATQKNKAKTKDKKKEPSTTKGRRSRVHPIPAEVSSARKYAAYQMRIMNPRMSYAAITVKINEMFPEHELKSDHQAVEKMIKEAEKEYIDAHKSKVEEVKAEAGAALDWVRQEAAEAWNRSQDLLKIVKKKEDQTVEQILKAEVGNAQFLKRITETVEVKTKIFGAQAPRKHEVTGKDGSPLGSPSIDMKRLRKFLSDGDLDILQQAAEVIDRAQHAYDASVTDGD